MNKFIHHYYESTSWVMPVADKCVVKFQSVDMFNFKR